MRYENREFTGRTFALDQNEFVNCRFVRCELTFSGRRDPQCPGTTQKDCTVRFVGAAEITLNMLRLMLADPGFAPLVLGQLGLIPVDDLPDSDDPVH